MRCSRTAVSLVLLLLAMVSQGVALFVQDGWLWRDEPLFVTAEVGGLALDIVSLLFLGVPLCMEDDCCNECKHFYKLVQVFSLLSGIAEFAGEVYHMRDPKSEGLVSLGDINITCVILSLISIIFNILNCFVGCCMEDEDQYRYRRVKNTF